MMTIMYGDTRVDHIKLGLGQAWVYLTNDKAFRIVAEPHERFTMTEACLTRIVAEAFRKERT